MKSKLVACLAAIALAVTIGGGLTGASAAGRSSTQTSKPGACDAYNPVLDPANFVGTVDNPYFPLPVGRTWVYRGIKNGQSQIDRVTVTQKTKVLAGITATTVFDVATHRGTLLERTFDWYAQDRQGNVWYLGENTTAYLPGGQKDKSGSWQAGVEGAKPGIIMEANPQIPDAYRQECRAGKAEDTAWIVGTQGSVKVPYGTLRHTLTSLETTRIEPGVVDEKIYAPGIGIVREQALAGDTELARLVSVTG